MPATAVSALAATAAALLLSTASLAKTPGEFHCYNGICHRVKSVDEMTRLVGMEVEVVSSFYDWAARDTMNAGTVTSSGEAFDADSDSHAASAYYPDGTELLVWNPKNRRAAHLRVNDFGPFYSTRTLDVTRGVAEKLDFVKSGVAKLRVIVIWAPGHEEARYRRFRQYASVSGYLGQIDADQLTAIKYRLTATASARNGYLAGTAGAPASEAPRMSLGSLPAYISPTAENSATRKLVGILNSPRFALAPSTGNPAVKPAVLPSALTAAPLLEPVRDPSQAAVLVVARDDAEAVPLVLTANDAPAAAAVLAADQPAPAARSISMAGVSLPDPELVLMFSLRVLPSGPYVWQQLGGGLAFLTMTALLFRRRLGEPRPARARTGLVPSDAVPGAGIGAAEPIDLPHVRTAPRTAALNALRDTAIACMERYAYAEAEAAYRKLLSAREGALGPNDPLCSSAERQLADCLREQGRYSAAEPHYRRALTTLTGAAGEMHPAVADILDEYATSVLRQGYGGRAEVLARQSLSIRRSAQPGSREYALTLAIVAETLKAQGQLVAAEIEHRTAMTVLTVQAGPDSLEVAASQLGLGTLLGELGRYAAAEGLLNQATRTLTATYGTSHPAAAFGYGHLGDLYQRAGNLDQSLAMHRHALAIRESTLGSRHPDTIESVLALATLAADQDHTDKAHALLERALVALISSERTHFGPQSRTRAALVMLAHYFETARPQAMAAE